ncbi:hypothetical protein NWP17_01530 [Chrysosporum bergii ANA360D]|uniref:Uncharacterized protein n=1 Tax=Chrysosporum bergii ANA360D TaxID=617107 RepID=A0AA43GPD9_9CYAN|nr:hypothetical protein [Chrysosporum bergii]MDH6059134.1 hypothetical protein [Chrysosporum bergii ANA360D]
MNSSYNKSYPSRSILSNRNIILICIAWGVLTLLYFLLFSAKIPGQDGIEKRADWYLIGTNIFEGLAYLGAGVLCLRNWRSPQIVSSRKVWLAIAMAMFCYFLGVIFFGYTEIVLGEEPDVSYGDIFFVPSYIFVSIGMILAVSSRRLNLEKWQLLILSAIAMLGSLLAWWLTQETGALQQLAAQQTSPLEQLAAILSLFYVVSDVVLLIIATTLLLAFWGGKASHSWRMIAAATISLYIADMWFKYAQERPNYQSGDILEVFWVFSGILFGMGAVLEHEASLSRIRRERGRKRA